MSDDRESLAWYQAELLELLHEASDVELTNDEMRALAEKVGLTLGDVDRRMLEVAILLTKKWGVR